MTAPKRTSGNPADPVTTYARDVLAGRIVAGLWVRLACERHLRDLERADLVWDLDAALRAIGFFRDVLRHSAGQFAGLPFELVGTGPGGAWEAFIVGSLFGWKLPEGTRRFETAYVEVAKGDGKTPLAAGIGHYMAWADEEMAAEVYAAAAKKDQAMVLYRDAVAMRDASPNLRKRLKTSGKFPHTWNMAHLASRSFFRPISSEDDSQSGPRPHCGLVDELHEHRSPVVVEMLRAGFKWRRQPLLFCITNSGFDRTTVCWEHHEYVTRILRGEVQQDRWFGYIATLDACATCTAAGHTAPQEDCPTCDQITDEAVWVKANPNLDVSVTVEQLRKRVLEAQQRPAIANEVRRLNFSLWTQSHTRWIPEEAWRTRAEVVAEAERIGAPCWAGLACGQADDLAALVRLWAVGDRLAVDLRAWLPESAVRAHPNRAIRDWVKAGHIVQTEGNVTDYVRIGTETAELCEAAGVRELAFVKRHLEEVGQRLDARGLVTVDTPLGYNLNEPLRRLMDAIIVVPPSEGIAPVARLCHSGNPVLGAAAAAMMVRTGPNNELRPDRQRATGNIVPIEALVLAFDRMLRTPPSSSVYDRRGLLELDA